MDRRQFGWRAAALFGWLGVAGVGLVMITQAFGIDGFGWIATFQALTPYGIPLVAVIVSIAHLRRLHRLAATGALTGLSILILAMPIAFPADQPRTRADSIGVSAAAVNLLYSNPSAEPAAAELALLDPDLLVFSEFTHRHAIALGTHPLSDRYPYQINDARPFANGMALWSKYPLSELDRPASRNRTIEAIFDGPDGPLQVFGVHPPTPVFDHDLWQRDLAALADQAAGTGMPTLMLGDFNASYWHPAFRSMLDHGLVDAHTANGHGWSTSWPTDEIIPAFVRLDHALTGNGLVATGVADFDVPGSDHAGFVVTVKPEAG